MDTKTGFVPINEKSIFLIIKIQRMQTNHFPTASNSIFLISQINYDKHRKFAKIFINEVPIILQIETASDITTLSHSNWLKLGSPSKVENSSFSKKCT